MKKLLVLIITLFSLTNTNLFAVKDDISVLEGGEYQILRHYADESTRTFIVNKDRTVIYEVDEGSRRVEASVGMQRSLKTSLNRYIADHSKGGDLSQKREAPQISSEVSSVQAKRQELHPNVGLKNGGQNICYLNALVQCISNLKKFRTELLKHQSDYDIGSIIFNLIELFKELRSTPGNDAVINQAFVDQVKDLIKRQGQGNKATSLQDSNEVLTLLLDEISKVNAEAVEPLKKSFYQQFNCSCGNIKTSDERDLHFKFELSFPEEGLISSIGALLQCKTNSTLKDLLDYYFSDIKLQGYKCEHCQRQGTTNVKNKILTFSDELIISLKRFREDGSKINTHVSFPIELDLKPYTIDSMKEDPTLNITYELVSFVCHGENHYVSFVKDFQNGRWYFYNDSSVKEVNESDIQQFTASGIVQNYTPYILFYSRREIDRLGQMSVAGSSLRSVFSMQRSQGSSRHETVYSEILQRSSSEWISDRKSTCLLM